MDKESLKDSLAQLFENAEIRDDKIKSVEIGKFKKEQIDRIKEATCFDCLGYRIIINYSDVIHVIKKHANNVEKYRKQLDITGEHFSYIVDVLYDFDTVEFQPKNREKNKSHDSLFFEKTKGNQKYCVALSVIYRDKKLFLKTKWINIVRL